MDLANRRRGPNRQKKGAKSGITVNNPSHYTSQEKTPKAHRTKGVKRINNRGGLTHITVIC
jgi:hypothetical protein